MASYSQCAAHIRTTSDLAAEVWLSADGQHLELQPVGFELPAGEDLRIVGTAGLCGAQPMFTFKKLLSPVTIQAIEKGFLDLVSAVFGSAHLEVAALEEMFSLPDTRSTLN